MIQNVQILTRNDAYWQDNEWKKLLSTAFSSPKRLLEHLNLDLEQLPYSVLMEHPFRQRVPQPFVDRMEKENPLDPLLLQILPLHEESQAVSGYVDDPLGEHKSAIPGLLHKYKSRVLVMLATACAVNCRYCFRREFPYANNNLGKSQWSSIINYLQSREEINEVILSGGDPLVATDDYLAEFIAKIETVEHIKRLRIHSRLPVVIPQRVTSQLTEVLQTSRLQCVFVTHINHPNEIDKTLGRALKRLHNAGVQLLNQSVLLNGINDDSDTLVKLSEKLFANHVIPYYLHLLDKVKGAHHFDTDEEDAIAIMHRLQRELAGFLVPKLVREEAGKASKSWIDLANNNQ
ncbi:EF-P beta-lysylation protein EpmB [Kangiella sediminilitoris]|uniref:L-lysine 2,3-aminomutase n=1 Tax=Kangiella sediminilitoris TaxID=1144748 RepID=A0A1B3B931_9GAMM|nr:EF-P beta-lysylation protein EpmB [Kangiella sediminilitoris]AOE49285.1 Lysine 2,3-aminomutase YodO family protein [Kangiella sediminilitoris]